MKNVIADHWLANKRIPKGEVWVREDWWRNEEKRKRLIAHEKTEINLMKKGVPYRRAHRIAEKFERNVLKVLRRKRKKKRRR